MLQNYPANRLEKEKQRRRLFGEKRLSHLERNYHCPYGETDIIAEDGQYIIFVEVKTRKSGAMVEGAEAVDTVKRKKLAQTAQAYLSEHPSGLQPRFDVILVTPTEENRCRVEQLPGAFVLGE